MQVSEVRVEEYQKIYFEEYGKQIDKVRARAELTALVCLLEAVNQFNNQENL